VNYPKIGTPGKIFKHWIFEKNNRWIFKKDKSKYRF